MSVTDIMFFQGAEEFTFVECFAESVWFADLMAKWSVGLFGGAVSAREVQTEGLSLARTTVLFTPEAWGMGVVAKGQEVWTTVYLP